MEEFNDPDKRELVEKFRAEYITNQARKQRKFSIFVVVGICVLIIGIITLIRGFGMLFEGDYQGYFGGFLVGLLMVMGSIPLFAFTLTGRSLAKRDTLVAYVSQRLRQEELKNPEKLMEAVGAKSPQKNCPFCGHINSESDKICAHCGASI